MKIDQILRSRLEALFAPLNKVAAVKAFPNPGSLSTAMEAVVPAKRATACTVTVPPATAALFTTAAVEVWMRAVHSFLVSASLTEASPIWASASGYYSSHYSVRALAHLLGYYQLFRKKRIVRLDMHNGKHVCTFDPKLTGDREHRFYWKIVKSDQHFASDPLFTDNNPEDDASDVGHRDRANYADHIFQLPSFRTLDADTLKRRVEYISQIEFTTPPIPKRSRFPDVNSVQVVAYHRAVRFRQFVDEVLGGGNRFWRVHRNPAWVGGMIDFQLTEQGSLASLKN